MLEYQQDFTICVIGTSRILKRQQKTHDQVRILIRDDSLYELQMIQVLDISMCFDNL